MRMVGVMDMHRQGVVGNSDVGRGNAAFERVTREDDLSWPAALAPARPDAMGEECAQ
jgi:hypothetical protein